MTNTDPLFIHINGDSVTIKPRADGSFCAEYRCKDDLMVKANVFKKLSAAKSDARDWLGDGASAWKRIGALGHVYEDQLA